MYSDQNPGIFDALVGSIKSAGETRAPLKLQRPDALDIFERAVGNWELHLTDLLDTYARMEDTPREKRDPNAHFEHEVFQFVNLDGAAACIDRILGALQKGTVVKQALTEPPELKRITREQLMPPINPVAASKHNQNLISQGGDNDGSAIAYAINYVIKYLCHVQKILTLPVHFKFLEPSTAFDSTIQENQILDLMHDIKGKIALLEGTPAVRAAETHLSVLTSYTRRHKI